MKRELQGEMEHSRNKNLMIFNWIYLNSHTQRSVLEKDVVD